MVDVNIHVDSLYACHIAYLVYLLKLPNANIIASDTNKVFDFVTQGYLSVYQNVLKKQYIQTGWYVQDASLFEWFIKNTFTFFSTDPTPGITIDITMTNSLLDAQNDFFTQLDSLNIIKDLNKYEINFTSYDNSIKYLIETLYSRQVTQEEIYSYHIKNGLGLYNLTDDRFIDLFTFLHVLHFNEEGRSKGLHLPFLSTFKSIKYTVSLNTPIFALLLSGHTRNYRDFLQSHKQFIDNPYIDIFIHTWIHQGPRYEFVKEPIDISALSLNYNPAKILVENEDTLKDTFSFRGKLDPIFLIEGQEGDDASRYENAKLYSCWKAFTLLQQYEQEINFQYDAVIKFGFNIGISMFNFEDIIKDVGLNILNNPKKGLYVSKYIHSQIKHPRTGGCTVCERELKANPFYRYEPSHLQHSNDIGTLWYYGQKDVVQTACELYLFVESMMSSHHQNNLLSYLNVPYRQYRDVVYILSADNYQGRVVTVDDNPTTVFCFYMEGLMREHMAQYSCITSSNIKTYLYKFDIDSNKL